MARSRQGKPGVLMFRGERYRATVLRVVESDGRGPRTFQIVRDDETTEVKDGLEFWVVYASETVLDAPRPH